MKNYHTCFAKSTIFIGSLMTSLCLSQPILAGIKMSEEEKQERLSKYFTPDQLQKRKARCTTEEGSTSGAQEFFENTKRLKIETQEEDEEVEKMNNKIQKEGGMIARKLLKTAAEKSVCTVQ